MEEGIEADMESYKLRGTKPAMAFYGSFSEMLQTMSLRNKNRKQGKKAKQKERFGETLRCHATEYGFAETG